MSLDLLETIGGPNGETEIYEYEPEGLNGLINAIGHVPNKYMLRFNGDLIGHYDDLHEARSEAKNLLEITTPSRQWRCPCLPQRALEPGRPTLRTLQ